MPSGGAHEIPTGIPPDELRLMARVAHLYHEDGLRQAEIASRFGLSQARVSRLLKRAVDEGVVRISVLPVPGVNTGDEEALEERFGLRSAVVVDTEGDRLVADVGAAAAYHLETSLRSGQLVGISSRSTFLRSTLEQVRLRAPLQGVRVVQILGGLGDPSETEHANRLTEQMAARLGGEPVFLPTPAVTGSPESARALLEDPFVAKTVQLYDHLDVAIMGIGSVDRATITARSAGALTERDLRELMRAGAVGDACLRFFDRRGKPVRTALSERVIGVELDRLRSTPHGVCVAGGLQKAEAIRGALLAGFVDVLVTDHATARKVLAGG